MERHGDRQREGKQVCILALLLPLREIAVAPAHTSSGALATLHTSLGLSPSSM